MLRSALVCFVLLTPVMAAATPATVPIQGTLLDSSGNAVNGTKAITFAIYSQAVGGAAIYTETQSTVLVEYGVFTAYIGDVTPLSLATFDGTNRWLGVTVGTDAEMTPRLRFGTVPYAAFAETTGAAGIPSGAVMFFVLSTCPTGWTAYTTAQGRTVVGLPSAGTLEGTNVTVGSLTNGGARTITQVPSHSHGISAQTTSSAGYHTHTVTSNVSVNAAGAHSHGFYANSGVGGGVYSLGTAAAIFSTGLYWTTDSQGNHSHTVNNPAVTSSDVSTLHTHTTPAFNSDLAGVASVDVTMPYVQLLACRKN